LKDKRYENIIKLYLHSDIVKDYKRYFEVSDMVEKMIYYGYDPAKGHRLYWGNMDCDYSPDIIEHWLLAIEEPEVFPFIKNLQTAIDEIIFWKPNLICISCISDTQIFATLSIASKIRAFLPDRKILIGGQAFRSRKNLFIKTSWLFKTVDAVCVSHGEPTVDALAKGMPMEKVPNIIWLKGKEVYIPNKIKVFKFSNKYQSDFSVLRLDSYLSPQIVIPIETARGCPWSNCSFCGHPSHGFNNKAPYVIRPIESVVGEIRSHLSSGNTKYFFVDEAIPYDRFSEICCRLIEFEEKISWICYLRLEARHNYETFVRARKSGCRKIFFGLETASDRLLKLHRKGFSVKTAKRVLNDANRAGIAIHLFMITGFPDEMQADRNDSNRYLKEIITGIDAFGFSYDVFPLSAEIDTPLYLNPEKFGAKGIVRMSQYNFAYRYDLVPSKNQEGISLIKAKRDIKSIIEECLGRKDGLRNYQLSQDANHLLLIDGRALPTDAFITT
jgi:thymidine kinase